jgi:cell division protein FtsN
VTPSRRRTPILFVSLAILLSGAGLIAYQYKKHPEHFPVAAATFSRFTNWLSQKKQTEQEDGKAKSLADNEDVSHSKIHFEFYTALPNMHMEPITKINKPAPETVTPKTTEIAQTSVINPAELERDFSTQLVGTQPYVVQLGVFGNFEAANGYKQSLHRAGFNVDVVKIPSGSKIAYRVQFGPFNSKDQARVVQKQLLKKNVSALIRKAVAL